MNIKTINIKNLAQGDIGIGKDCHLCGEPFMIGMYDTDTICPKCKELWKEFVASRSMTLSVEVNKDMELKVND